MIVFLNWGQAIQGNRNHYCRLPGKNTRRHEKASVTAYFKVQEGDQNWQAVSLRGLPSESD